MALRTITALGMLALSCMLAAPGEVGAGSDPAPLLFAVTGNTFPESPYVGFTESMPVLVDALNRENPLFVIHTGNMVQGGGDHIGIIRKDVTRQFSLFRDATAKLSMPLYTLAGERDLHNGTADIYMKEFGRGLNYSFNYENIHIAVFNTVDTLNSPAGTKKALRWLKDDLRSNKKRGMIIVVTHNALFSPAKGEKPPETAERIHEIIKKYRVAAVISGDRPEFFTLQKDSVSYINAGCGAFGRQDRCRGCGQYYLVTWANGTVKAVQKYIKKP